MTQEEQTVLVDGQQPTTDAAAKKDATGGDQPAKVEDASAPAESTKASNNDAGEGRAQMRAFFQQLSISRMKSMRKLSPAAKAAKAARQAARAAANAAKAAEVAAKAADSAAKAAQDAAQAAFDENTKASEEKKPIVEESKQEEVAAK